MVKDPGDEMGATRSKRFAASLTRVFRSMDVPNRVWARWLGVSEGAVSQWTTDACAPSARNIYRIVSILRDARSRLDPEVVLEFSRVLSEDAASVTAGGARLGSTLGNYMLKPLRESLLSALDALPTRAQEELLLSSLEACTSLSDRSDRDFDLFASSQQRRVRVIFSEVESSNIVFAEKSMQASTIHFSSDELRGWLALFACETFPMASRLANKPTSPKLAREVLWKLEGCAPLADALDQAACTAPVLLWAREIVEQHQPAEYLFPLLRGLVDKSLRVYHKRYAWESEVAQALRRAHTLKRLYLVEAEVLTSDPSILRDISISMGANYPDLRSLKAGRLSLWCERVPREHWAVRPLSQCEVVVAEGTLEKWQNEEARPPRNGLELLEGSSVEEVTQATEEMVLSLRQAVDPWADLQSQGPQLLGHAVESLPLGVADMPTFVSSLAKTLETRVPSASSGN